MSRARLALIAAAAFALGAVWRFSLALGHYRRSLTILDVPSAKELEEASLILEIGLGVVLLFHAVGAGFFIRRPVRVDPGTCFGVFVLVGVLTVSSFLRLPVLGAAGALPVALTVAGGAAGFLTEGPWLSVYLGALAGSVVGVRSWSPDLDLPIMVAVAVPAVLAALIGVSFGRFIRRLHRVQEAS